MATAGCTTVSTAVTSRWNGCGVLWPGCGCPAGGDRIVLAVDVSPWLRPDASTSPDRLLCHTYGRAKSTSQLIPRWPYSFVAALETGRTSWNAILDAVRLGPADDVADVTRSRSAA